jgi:hypothetical protein
MAPNKASPSEDEMAENPLDRVLKLLQQVKKSKRGWTAHCPSHSDQHPSLEIWIHEDGSVWFKCYASCSTQNIVDALGLTLADLFPRKNPESHSKGVNHQPPTLLDLALYTRIHPTFLVNLGLLDDFRYRQFKGIKIPYYDTDGAEAPRCRIRTALSARAGSFWTDGGASLVPYGLWRLEEARTAGFLVICEGESDCWTLWLHHFPCLGLPGAGMYNLLEQHYLAGIERIYVIQEADIAGRDFVRGIGRRLQQIAWPGKAYIVSLNEAKDPNALHKREKQHFAVVFQEELDAAVPLEMQISNKPDLDTLVTQLVNDGDIDAVYAAADLLAEATKSEYTIYKTRLKATFGRRLHLKDLDACVREAQRKQRQTLPAISNLPNIIINNRPLREISADALEALLLANHPPCIFVRSGSLVRFRQNEKGRPLIEPLYEAALRGRLTRVADFQRLIQEMSVHVSPPKDVVQDILSLGTWPLPPLEAIVETPVLKTDGTILDTAGYDALSQLIYIPSNEMQACKVPEQPARQEVEQALKLLWSILGEFPYVDASDKANALALLLTPLLRPVLRHVPLALIDAPKQGTGKSLLAEVIALVVTGRNAAVITEASSEEEWSKLITSLLLEGATLISIDNVTLPLRSARLAAALTSDEWRNRLLGQSKTVIVPQRATWLATGNNIRVSGDMVRRCYRIRLDAKMSRPWRRRGFCHPDLLAFVALHRSEIIAALLTLVRAWYVAGQPAVETPGMATFSGWSDMLGSLLAFAGVEDFLGNLTNLYDEDDEDAQWEAFLRAWKHRLGERAVTVAQLMTYLLDETDPTLAEALPDTLAPTRIDPGGNFQRKLGKALAKHVDTCFGDENLRLERAGKDAHTKNHMWRVCSVTYEETNTAQDKGS